MTAARETEIADLLRETPISAGQAANRCGVSIGAVVRWIRTGKAVGSATVRLAGFKAGRSWQTSEEALARFLAACSAPTGAPPPESENCRRVAMARARFNKVLKRLGRRAG